MAFGNITTLYIPVAANAGTSQWGTDVRKLLDSADSVPDNDTRVDHGVGGVTVRTLDPYTVSTADGVEANFGWAITPADMNSIAGAKRFYPAGNHTLTVRMNQLTVGALAVTGTLFMYVYRVGDAAGGRVRTLLASNSSSVVLPALNAAVEATVSVNLPNGVVFEIDETIQYSFEFSCEGQVITGRVVIVSTGVNGGVQARVATPKLGVLADTVGTATGTGTATGVTGNVLGTIGSVTGIGTASGVMSSIASTTGSAAGTVTVNGQGSSVAGTIGTTSGSVTVSGQTSIVLGTVGTVNIGGGGGGGNTYSRSRVVNK